MNEDRVIGHIYILLFPSGKRYVGQTIRSVEKRLGDHLIEVKRGCTLPIHNAMRHYGKKDMVIEKVFTFKCTQEYLDLIEDRAISKFNTMVPNGYNLRRGGGHGVFSDEVRKRLSLMKKGRPGKPHSEETKMKISANNYRRGRPLSQEEKTNLSIINTGKVLSEETKAKISAAGKGKIRSQETRAKISMARKGKPRSEETRAKISATRKKRGPYKRTSL